MIQFICCNNFYSFSSNSSLFYKMDKLQWVIKVMLINPQIIKRNYYYPFMSLGNPDLLKPRSKFIKIRNRNIKHIDLTILFSIYSKGFRT